VCAGVCVPVCVCVNYVSQKHPVAKYVSLSEAVYCDISECLQTEILYQIWAAYGSSSAG